MFGKSEEAGGGAGDQCSCCPLWATHINISPLKKSFSSFLN